MDGIAFRRRYIDAVVEVAETAYPYRTGIRPDEMVAQRVGAAIGSTRSLGICVAGDGHIPVGDSRAVTLEYHWRGTVVFAEIGVVGDLVGGASVDFLAGE